MLTRRRSVSHILRNDHQDLFPKRDDHGSRRVRYHRHTQAEAPAKEEMSVHLHVNDNSVATFRMRTLSIATIFRRFAELLSAQLAACEMNQRDLRVLPVRTHPTCRQPACLSTDCRKPKLTSIPAHIHNSHAPPSMATSLPTTFASSTINFDNWLLTFFSALHNIFRPAFLATSFTLLLRSIASQRNSLYACVTLHHRHILPTHQSAFLGHRRFWFTKKRLGYIGGDTKGSWYRTKRHQQSNLPYRDITSSEHHHLYNYLWAYFSATRAFLVKDLLTA